jgi:hypothetical protein
LLKSHEIWKVEIVDCKTIISIAYQSIGFECPHSAPLGLLCT